MKNDVEKCRNMTSGYCVRRRSWSDEDTINARGDKQHFIKLTTHKSKAQCLATSPTTFLPRPSQWVFHVNDSAHSLTFVLQPEVSSPSLFGQNMTPKSDAPDSPPEFTENQYGEMSTVRGHLDRSWTYGVVEHPEHEHHSVIHTLKGKAYRLTLLTTF